jgi:hypothetical protein
MMREFVDSTMWRTRGSSVVFDKVMLGSLLNEGSLVSLRQALRWLDVWPSMPPVFGQSVLVAGLDAVLEVLPREEAEGFARQRIRKLIAEFQDRWTEFSLVFGLNTPAQRIWEDPVTEHVFFITRTDERICLSTDLWNGSATTDMGRLVRTDDRGKLVVGGYYAPRS